MRVAEVSRAPRPIVLALVMLTASAVMLTTIPIGAQQGSSPTEPQLNQPGKDVQWVPTPPALVEKMLDLARLTPRDFLVDLGSGDGITVIAAAKRGARALGLEYDRSLVELARRNAAAAQVADRARFKRADIFKTDFSRATVVTTFLLPSLNLQLRPTILAMKPGTRVVSNTFPMGEWEPDETATIEPCDHWCTALLWIVPARIAGTWRTPQGELTLMQRFQNVTGTLEKSAISDARLVGDEFRFQAGNAMVAGRVDGPRITGTRTVEGRSAPWSATRR